MFKLSDKQTKNNLSRRFYCLGFQVKYLIRHSAFHINKATYPPITEGNFDDLSVSKFSSLYSL